jgi:hypothetical protein
VALIVAAFDFQINGDGKEWLGVQLLSVYLILGILFLPPEKA